MSTFHRTAAFHTLGCKLNFAETSTIARQLTDAGYDKVSFDDKANVYVINTCSVTENADRECKLHVKRAMKANPEGLVVIVGCYAQLKPEEISQIDGVDLVLGAKEKFNILSYLDDLEKTENEGIVHSCEIEETDFFIGSYSIGDRTRAFLKVQDGCDYKCTYCTIPLARGISRSDTIGNVLKNATEIAAKDIKEIVLTGVNIGDYGKGEFGNKKHEHTFLDLISELNKVEGIERIRISSIEPNLLKDESIELVSKSKSFVPHFHIPLQSGSDDLLKKMKRRYLTKLYNDRVNKIREVMPDAAIGVDVIVGFPGETEERFMETYNFLNELPITYLHVFTYSERENTEAADMEGVVPVAERKKRNKMLRILSEKKKMAFYQTQLGKTLPVLWEHENKDGKMFGFTENYVRVQKDFDPAFVNQIEFLNLEKILSDGTVSVQSSYQNFLAKA
ncbi:MULTISPECIES: tRNA (N(6)-L-threonylcarbamoyladenosine(37)-C(2))-methylthiotransferase MtaB [Chryseobacterium]|jgi:threonylcarbamoyladenosine tRNA methylthiotransferase MtaB|uniref:tRNA (N(6)-L-threonylcarbamoyladenosine(37)-C(2))-methylthiotransferase MtaB n=1 Tax=Chryseobacterium rhizosphaerae TaxID=395937 RepID=A0ABX9IFD8_9FLAO|nr:MULTISPECIES: tRNA (N(6)-L-threonylcarbamoyladenosine(37)-C(2))-methylthiotransferase MtaB [Chryseobacterium]MDR6544175.1 threonylcarbamoyladenosine tRNA methylthiotransferase MtaB [Chryseobacterium rhizosphaerae]REC71965.1 tRNA (N(6)-L-threonylcarbamoyladenosine(37)-C(2))-methylthiotransferase MtaB [Chryseobacterium rhizosphaerae]GEN69139.1 tRNA (N(6)-L-threonylcarbamoyladenosine(37)-C(2))-methylthiotransferase MtaB [Chryseobacterium rhizosphaerae]SMC85876.1 threonylcarbamoyladenosine tRNA 